MSGESGSNGGGYEHAGGYKPAFQWEPMTAREYAATAGFVAIMIAAIWLARKLLGPLAPGQLLTLMLTALGSVLLMAGARLVRAGRPGEGESARDPAAALDPAGADDDPIARRRRALGLGLFLIVLSLATFAYALSRLMNGLGGLR